MKRTFIAVFALVMALGLSVGSAEAARLGGGKSVGMQRQSVAQKPAAPAQQAAPGAPSAPLGASAAAPKRNWMGPLAGLAAGLGIAALFSSLGMGGMGGGMGNILMIALLAGAAFFVFRLISRRKTAALQPIGTTQFAGLGNMAAMPPAADPAPLFGSAAPTIAPVTQHVPADFDSTGFLRVAKLNFIRLQAANDAKDLADMREFVGPEMFAEIKMQMDERGNAAQQTDIVTLNAELLEVTTEANRHVASVHFSGMIREVVGSAAAPFNEIWHLSKPVDGSHGWVISGIQQAS